jgi:hypothetical protein
VKDMFLYELLRRVKGLFPWVLPLLPWSYVRITYGNLSNCNFDSLNEKVKYIEEDVSADGGMSVFSSRTYLKAPF